MQVALCLVRRRPVKLLANEHPPPCDINQISYQQCHTFCPSKFIMTTWSKYSSNIVGVQGGCGSLPSRLWHLSAVIDRARYFFPEQGISKDTVNCLELRFFGSWQHQFVSVKTAQTSQGAFNVWWWHAEAQLCILTQLINAKGESSLHYLDNSYRLISEANVLSHIAIGTDENLVTFSLMH